jgi:hypothetical protein
MASIDDPTYARTLMSTFNGSHSGLFDDAASFLLRHPMSSVGTGVFCPYAIRHCPDRSNHR